jgi:Tol biopolymer transport system component
MKHMPILLAIAVPFALAAGPAAQQHAPSADRLLARAQHLETAQGDLKGAIAQYEQLVRQFPNDRAVVANALVRMAGAYKKLGDAQSKTIYERVVREYGDQAGAAATARAALGAGGARAAAAGPATATMRRVWAGKGVNTNGGVSPDGRLIAYVDPDTGDLAVHDIETGENRRLTANTAGRMWQDFADGPVFSPDGRQVAYTWFVNDRYDVRIIDARGSAPSVPRQLHAPGESRWISVTDWSRDGKWLAVVFGMPGAGAQIGRLSTSDGTLEELQSALRSNPTKVLFSPDGRHVAFDVLRDGSNDDREVVVRPIAGGSDEFVAPAPGYDVLMAWSPDGTRLLFTSDRGRATSLWAVGVSAGRASTAPYEVNPGMGDESLGMTANGSLYLGVSARNVDIQTASIDLATGRRAGEAHRPIQRRIGANRTPQWSPDGTRMVFTSLGDRAWQGRTLNILDVRTRQVRELRTGLRSVSAPRWSPDGQSLLVQGDKDGQSGIYRIFVDTAEVTTVATSRPDASVYTPSWSPDGQRVFYTRRPRPGQPVCVEHDLTTGSTREIPGSGGLAQGLSSPDGRLLVGIRQGEATGMSEILVVPVNGGEPRVVHSVKTPGTLTWASWTPDGRHILAKHVVEGSKDPIDDAIAIPLDGGAPVRLDLPEVRFGFMSMHPDGKQIAYLAGEDEEEVWVLENFLSATTAAVKK